MLLFVPIIGPFLALGSAGASLLWVGGPNALTIAFGPIFIPAVISNVGFIGPALMALAF